MGTRFGYSRPAHVLATLGIFIVLAVVPKGTAEAVTRGIPAVTSRPVNGSFRNTLPRNTWDSPYRPASPYQAFEGELSRLEQDLFADAADGRWDEHSLLEAALIASGVHRPELLRHYEAQVAALTAELSKSGRLAGTEREQAQAIFEFMHRRVLRGGYQLDCTDLGLSLDKGRFNCVSASVLLNCLAGRLGLTAHGLEAPGHAMSRLILDGRPFDVETTCAAWFRLADDPAKQAAVVARMIGRLPGQGSPPPARIVTPVQLIATIYYNRGVDLLAENRFRDAVRANAKALRLDAANQTARGNLLATLNNWAINLAGHGHHARAVELLDRGLALDPTYETFKANYVHVHHQWIESLCSADHFQGALDVLAKAAGKQPQEPYFRQIRRQVEQHRARVRLETGRAGGTSQQFHRAG
jgi:tetratricopeptide (TPR) repeat protein